MGRQSESGPPLFFPHFFFSETCLPSELTPQKSYPAQIFEAQYDQTGDIKIRTIKIFFPGCPIEIP
jgi:hypothetical protein